MNRAELEAALATKFTVVFAITEVKTIENVTRYVASVLRTRGDAGTIDNIGFYVVDEGLPGEVAYWMNNEPERDLDPFETDLTAWLDSKIEDDTILFYAIVGYVRPKERALVEIVREDPGAAGSYIRQTFGVYKDGVGDFAFRIVN